ncbi:hypothetical protein JQ557_23645 [Bradyrhizobium sp. U87765 SZCCT0131]|uniref:hypothetical protein n=1 Tax=unclassified Bradyrhizobium TaxID=2631580 RepID=UPI001BAB1D98|nr:MULTISPECIES: hypothetical protein [unclassified Bradyrhizobium]MBR1221012.1 hypothetical protein [Bradyrhizobium sp. U87765 SZCCT0131]MBR1260168.1 hypothetical protein [Bradyrhizobium sp. U87765 SZCCT0134]MBR1307583.1 hypothetical protein [Bradyrhizobium sp. U87765 SZCCT0110]MBR1321537.1 hypothetical protein [Bradyrhizobium sp. U87765 SZCCT0109]MBR1349850.1 hypothetical protein [Bradyrhizobium sp. U87765 SZCCT0048]
MNTGDITWRLAQLSSLPFQERYGIAGTPNEYVVDVELLENVDSLKYIVRRPENEAVLTDAQRGALEDLFAYIEVYSGDALSAQSRDEAIVLIRESVIWKALRSKAATALQLFGLSAEMSIEEIDRLSE